MVRGVRARLALTPLVPAAACLAIGAVGPAAGGEVCAGTRAEVLRAEPGERDALCRGAEAAEAFLARCGIRPRRPYGVTVDPSLCDTLGRPMFGVYRPRDGVARIQPLEGCTAILDAVPPEEATAALRDVPKGEVYHSLIVHEITHAIVQQNLRVVPNLTVHEYVSGVAQIEALGEEARAAYLSRFPGPAPSTPMLNALTLAMDPIRFGVGAWRHFHQPENGCAFLNRILDEEGVFPVVP